MDLFERYLTSHSGKEATHLSFIGGKYHVPPESLDDFLHEYYRYIRKGFSNVYFIEKVTDMEFRFFIDIDEGGSDAVVKNIISAVGSPCVVLKKQGIPKYHLIFDFVVDSDRAHEVVRDIETKVGSDIAKCIDRSVYRTGLRMIGSRKKPDDSSVYKVYNIDTRIFTENTDLDFETFVSTTVGATVPGGENPAPEGDVPVTLIEETYGDLGIRVKSAKHMAPNTFVSVAVDKCPFIGRPHKRKSSPHYVQITPKKMCLKCHDSDCEGKEYGVVGLGGSSPPLDAETRRVLLTNLQHNDYSIAKSIFDLFKDIYRVDDISHSQTWYKFNGVAWEKSIEIQILMSEEIRGMYKKLLNSMSDEASEEKEAKDPKRAVVKKIMDDLSNSGTKRAILSQLSILFKNHDPDFVQKLDSTPGLIAFTNGVYDLVKRRFRRAVPEDYLFHTTGYDYVPCNTEKKTEINSFLSQIIRSEKVLDYLLRVLGKSLFGIPDERFYFWTGIAGANGKSTLVTLIETALGGYHGTVDVSLFTGKRAASSNATPDVVRLKGRRIVTTQEPESNDKINMGIIKQFSGYDLIVARELYKAPIEFKMQCCLIMCCNDLPTITATDGGTWRRIRVIDFNSRFCDNPEKPNEFKKESRDTLRARFEEWKAHFMSMLISYCELAIDTGIQDPEEVFCATLRYKDNNNVFEVYFGKFIEVADPSTSFKTTSDIFRNFTAWWEQSNGRLRVPQFKAFQNALRMAYGQEIVRVIDGVRMYGYGMSFKEPDDSIVIESI